MAISEPIIIAKIAFLTNSFSTRIILVIGFFLLNSGLCLAEIHVTGTVSSDYVSRGYSKTDEGFALQANVDYEHSSGLFLGASIANVDFGDDDFNNPADLEITPYLGWSIGLTEQFRLDLQWTRYLYDGDIYGHESDYNEFYALLHYRDIFTARASFSENYYNQDKFSSDYEITGRYPITDIFEFSSGVGYSFTKKILEYDYLYWNAGVSYFFDLVSLDFRYLHAIETSTNNHNRWPIELKISNPSLVFSISVAY